VICPPGVVEGRATRVTVVVRSVVMLSLAVLCGCSASSAAPSGETAVQVTVVATSTPDSSTSPSTSTTSTSMTSTSTTSTSTTSTVPVAAEPFDPWSYLSALPSGTPASRGRPARIMVVGDSAAGSLGIGMERWAAEHSDGVVVRPHGWINCPVTPADRGRWLDGIEFEPDPGCFDVSKRSDAIAIDRPDVILAYSGIWELVDKKLRGSDRWSALGDPDVDSATRAALIELTDTLSASGARLVWVVQPPNLNGIYGKATETLPEEEPARVERLNDIITDVVAERPGVLLLDLPGAWEDEFGDRAGLVNRPDGFHWSDPGALRDAEWLVPFLAELATYPVEPAGQG
jgi:hypothetical protein